MRYCLFMFLFFFSNNILSQKIDYSINLLENRNDIEIKYGKKSDGYYLLIKDYEFRIYKKKLSYHNFYFTLF